MTGADQHVVFEKATVDATLRYLREPSRLNFETLVALPGDRLAYAHHRWSSPESEQSIEELWEASLAVFKPSYELEEHIGFERSALS